MDTKGYKTKSSEAGSYKKSGLMHKAVASTMAAFFIFYGIPMPTSFAEANRLTLNENQNLTPVTTLAEANLKKPGVSISSVPSGSLDITPGALSLPASGPVYGPFPAAKNESSSSSDLGQLQGDGNPQPVATEPAVPSGWTRAASNPNFAFKIVSFKWQYDIPYQKLEVMDLASGQGRTLLMVDVGLGHTEFTGKVDVSPGGNYFVYSLGDTETGIIRTEVVKYNMLTNGREGAASFQPSADFSSVIFESGQVVIRAEAYTHTVDLQTWMVSSNDPAVNVPIGWIRMPSNSRFAYQERNVSQSYINQVVYVIRNLSTGKEFSVTKSLTYSTASASSSQSSLGLPKISSRYVVHGYTSWCTRSSSACAQANNVDIYDVASGARIATIPLQGKAISEMYFVTLEQKALVHVAYADSASEYYEVATGKRFYLLPSGWTRAASNANFAFTTENYWGADNNNYTRLKVQDLTTGTVQELYSLQSPPFQYTVMDVSADGSMVYFGTRNNYTTTASGWFRVQQMNNASQKTDIQGIPSEAGFLANGNVSVTLLTAYRNGTELGNVYTVDHATMQSSLSHVKLVTQADAVLDEGYLIIPERVAYSNHFTVTVYDASQGTGRLVKKDHKIEYNASQAAGGSSGSGSYSLIDAYRTAAGRVLISVGISAVGNADVDYNATFILDPVTGQQLVFDGVAVAVDYAGPIARYSVKHRDGTSETIGVDLTTLTIIPPVPAGWTRAASNPNFAFKVEARRWHQILIARDLLTGKEIVVANIPIPFKIARNYDMAPDGKTVVYSMAFPGGYLGMTFVQSLSNPRKKILLYGVAAPVRFIGGLWVLTLNKRNVKVDPVKLRVVG